MRYSSKILKADWVFIVLASLVFLAGVAVALWDFIRLEKVVWTPNPLDIVGLVMFAGGTALRQVGKRTVGRNYSYGLRTFRDQKLIQRGVYKYVRHPITLAALIYTPGIPVVISSAYGFLVMLLLIPLFLYRIRIEEKMLLEKFGSDYREYMRRTKKLIPFLY